MFKIKEIWICFRNILFIFIIAYRLNLYKELNQLSSEEEIVNFIKQLEDRFGKVPDEIFILCDALRLRWLGKQIGFERVILKDEKMRAYFTSKADSPYYNSSSFNLVLNYLKTNFENCKIIETKGKLSLRISNITSLKEVLAICNSILEK